MSVERGVDDRLRLLQWIDEAALQPVKRAQCSKVRECDGGKQKP
jgi:hypothetical protein